MQDTNPPSEHKNPEQDGTSETSEAPMPEKPTMEDAENAPTPGEYVLLVFIHVLIAHQVNRHTMRKNPDPHLRNRPPLLTPTVVGRTPATLLTLGVNDIDGTGRLPEFASRWLFHVSFSSIRGSPGSFAVFFILGDFVGYTVLFVSFLYPYAGISRPQPSPLYSRDIGVL